MIFFWFLEKPDPYFIFEAVVYTYAVRKPDGSGSPEVWGLQRTAGLQSPMKNHDFISDQ